MNLGADFRDIGNILERRAAAVPDHRAYTFLVNGRDEGRVLTYGRLYDEACRGASLLRQHVSAGDRVLLVHDDSLDFIVAFMACMFARVTAVPIPPPDLARLKRTLPRLQSVIADCKAAAVLGNFRMRQKVREAFGSEVPGEAVWLALEDSAVCPLAEPLEARPADLAFLQYTSGSTSSPKGVMVTHANVLDNLHRLQQCFRYSSESATVTWMPYFHDYGLIDGLLEPLYSQAPCHVISPVAFIKRPLSWLEAVSRYRATHIHGPDFAYRLCLERLDDDRLTAMDLSCLEVAGCAAEPIRLDTATRFITGFSRYGFREKSFFPAYGMAEATLVISAKSYDESWCAAFLAPEELERNRCVDVPADLPRARAVIGCGVRAGDFELVIVDQETLQELPDNQVGEIWLANPSVASGYWNRPEETKAAFEAFTATGRGPMLRTGDTGFVRSGEIFVTGRLKDLLIVNGSNHYPQDIEQTVESIGAGIRPTCVAAFAVEHSGGERLVIVAEIGRGQHDTSTLLVSIRTHVSLEHELSCWAILLLPRGSIHKTSSGKVQRNACRQAFLAGEFEPVAEWRTPYPPAVPAATGSVPFANARDCETWLRGVVAKRKHLAEAQIDVSEPFASFGLSSVEAVGIAGFVEEQTGRVVPATALWEYPNIRLLAKFISGCAEGSETLDPTPTTAEPVAIVGMACNFPGVCKSIDAFWEVLRKGEPMFSDAPRGRFPASAAPFRAGYLENIFRFDAQFFGISDSEARSMDPQQRMLLETAWHALEDAGIPPAQLAGSRAGVFVGVSSTDYAHEVYGIPGQADRFAATGTSASVIANRLSYFLDLRGPSLTIDTACSASLVAIDQACVALRTGAADMVIAGGVNALLSHSAMVTLREAGMLSPSEQCLPFDPRADGYVRGEGCGVIVLRKLSDAISGGDRIHAVIRGSAVVQDGRSNGLTAPTGAGQQAVVRAALARSGIAPESVEYIETHGTGTVLGDSIELRALVESYGKAGSQPCHLGAVKSCLGHLEGAAGVAGVIKTVLAFRHETIPPGTQTHAGVPAELSGSRLILTARSKSWPARATPRLAGVSSFGFGGTLAHVILGDYAPGDQTSVAGDDEDRKEVQDECYLLPLSARDPQALLRLAARYVESRVPPASLCAAAALTRTHFSNRAAFVFRSREQLIAQLSSFRESCPPEPSILRVGFDFTCEHLTAQQGLQLHRRFGAFREALRELDPVLVAALGASAVDVLSGACGSDALRVFLLHFGLLAIWRSWGVIADFALGADTGYYGAAVAAGIFPPAEAIRLILADSESAKHDRQVISSLHGIIIGIAGSRQHSADGTATTSLLHALSEIYVSGAKVNWQAVYPVPSSREPLPLYPFGGREHRIAPPVDTPARSEHNATVQALTEGNTEEVVRQLQAHALLPQTDSKTLNALIKAVASLIRQQSSDKPGELQTWKTEWQLVLPTGRQAVLLTRDCIILGESSPERTQLVNAVHRSSLLRHASLAGARSPLIVITFTARPSEPPDEAALRSAGELIRTLREIRARHPRAEVWAVTRGAVSLAAEPLELEGSCIWGIGKTAALEMPDLWGGLVDLPAGMTNDDADSILSFLASRPEEDQLAFRNGRWFAPRLASISVPQVAPLTLRADAVYWVTGGTGGLGGRVVELMRERGARHIFISARGKIRPPALPQDDLDPAVCFLSADLRSRSDILKVLANIDSTGLPLAGIVHAAGIVTEYPIEQLSEELFREVAAPKVIGAWNLHELTKGRGIDFFVCFSSVSSVWGASGQAHYAAANHFLDTLCMHRRESGEPALAINWGPWSGGGMVTAEREARLCGTGVDLMEPEEAKDLLARLIAGDLSAVAAARVRWERFGPAFTARRPSPLLSRVFGRVSASPEKSAPDPVPSRHVAVELAGLSPILRKERVRDEIRTVVAAFMGEGRRPETTRGFFEMGLDSLGIVAIRNRLVTSLGVQISKSDMFDFPSVEALAGRILDLLPSAPAPSPAPADSGLESRSLSETEMMASIARDFELLMNDLVRRDKTKSLNIE